MKLYLVERTDRVGYDEFGGFVVRAENAEKALEMCIERDGSNDFKNSKYVEVKELNENGLEEIILESFNAG